MTQLESVFTNYIFGDIKPSNNKNIFRKSLRRGLNLNLKFYILLLYLNANENVQPYLNQLKTVFMLIQVNM